MKLTNKTGLPQAIVDAVKNDDYDPGVCDISVTQLVGPPQIRVLRKAHEDEIEEDVADRIWALLGQAVHTILERATARGIAERRISATIGGYRISGQFDSLAYEPSRLADYKVTSAWTYVREGVRPDWASQLNCYAWLAQQHNLPVQELAVVALYRDWSYAQAQRNPDYPQSQVMCLTVPMWSSVEVESYLYARLDLHFAEQTPPCTDEDCWAKPQQWAVMKKGRDSALRVLPTEDEALTWASNKEFFHGGDGWAPGYYLQERPREYVRCERYCPVSQFCGQSAARAK